MDNYVVPPIQNPEPLPVPISEPELSEIDSSDYEPQPNENSTENNSEAQNSSESVELDSSDYEPEPNDISIENNSEAQNSSESIELESSDYEPELTYNSIENNLEAQDSSEFVETTSNNFDLNQSFDYGIENNTEESNTSELAEIEQSSVLEQSFEDNAENEIEEPNTSELEEIEQSSKQQQTFEGNLENDVDVNITSELEGSDQRLEPQQSFEDNNENEIGEPNTSELEEIEQTLKLQQTFEGNLENYIDVNNTSELEGTDQSLEPQQSFEDNTILDTNYYEQNQSFDNNSNLSTEISINDFDDYDVFLTYLALKELANSINLKTQPEIEMKTAILELSEFLRNIQPLSDYKDTFSFNLKIVNEALKLFRIPENDSRWGRADFTGLDLLSNSSLKLTDKNYAHISTTSYKCNLFVAEVLYNSLGVSLYFFEEEGDWFNERNNSIEPYYTGKYFPPKAKNWYSDEIAGFKTVNIEDAILGDLWTNGDHTGIYLGTFNHLSLFVSARSISDGVFGNQPAEGIQIKEIPLNSNGKFKRYIGIPD